MEYRRIKKSECPHHTEIRITSSVKTQCAQCSASTHLRQCTACGEVFCCESERAHNKEHFQETGHPIIKSHSTPYDFFWCYVCTAYLE